MPFRAGLLLMVLLSGCGVWPNQAHRALTTDSMATIIEQQCTQPLADSHHNALAKQQITLTQIQAQLDALIQPNASSAYCTPPEAAAKSNHEFEGKTVVGASEWIYLSPPGHHYQARVDSGAATSSLSAQNIEYFERDGKRWVRFALQHDDETTPIMVEAKVVRHVLIRQASSSETQRRPVISLTVNLGQTLRYDTEFTLTNRSLMNYSILLGREFLRDVILIDVAQKFIQPKYTPQNNVMQAVKPSVQFMRLNKDAP